MAFIDRIANDNRNVFMNTQQLGRRHTWNGKEFITVPDEEMQLKRANNNVVDVSWDNNRGEMLLWTVKEDFPDRVVPYELIFFDNRPYRVIRVQEDEGMLGILIGAEQPRAITGK